MKENPCPSRINQDGISMPFTFQCLLSTWCEVLTLFWKPQFLSETKIKQSPKQRQSSKREGGRLESVLESCLIPTSHTNRSPRWPFSGLKWPKAPMVDAFSCLPVHPPVSWQRHDLSPLAGTPTSIQWHKAPMVEALSHLPVCPLVFWKRHAPLPPARLYRTPNDPS